MQQTNTLLGDCSITAAGPCVWNSLPMQLQAKHSKHIVRSLPAAVPSDSVFCALCINWLSYLLTGTYFCSSDEDTSISLKLRHQVTSSLFRCCVDKFDLSALLVLVEAVY